ncbi:WW domain binding protein VOPP1-like [Saccostrea echinata]|uniref:WW domain binding protein VOPP1-like n=1 Tax=Saccostrea echinata TaxID=191078 RepID=UPI002A7FC06E|nr:WW domain binding protein VOPP1-like [Saccostrea echinata]
MKSFYGEMGSCDGLSKIYGFILVQLILFSEVSGIICPKTGESCESCCEGRCCVNDEETISYTYRISFWNLWYFWFVVLFILMSCFGGCGYYKHRQRLLMMPRDTFVHRGRPNARNTPGFGIMPTPATVSNSRPAQEQTSVSVLPPPYSEVAKQPRDHFETKPPPYPGNRQDMPGGVNPPEYSKDHPPPKSI